MPSTYLTVPFREKDEAKALGARWDPAQRSWYAPAGADLDAFRRWLPATEQGPAPARADTPTTQSTAPPPPAMAGRRTGSLTAGLGTGLEAGLGSGLASSLGTGLGNSELVAHDPATTALTAGSPRGLPLSQLLTAVSRVVSASFPEPVWVTAEVVHARLVPQGHVYLELSERNPAGQLIAKANGMIWASTARAILPAFEKATQATLAAGLKLLVRVRPVFNAQYGFSLEIDAIDPAYTLGDLEARKREIRERLQREGLFDRNRRLAPPWDYNAVIVIAPEAAAGLGDFREEARRLERHGLCEFIHAFSRFQGEGAAAAILEAATVTLAGRPRVDALVFLRGGGAVNDLAWLNDYALARFICECPVPVLTGIGHERDSTTLDEVAHRAFDTPSKVIAGIEQRIRQRADEAREAMAIIAGAAADDVTTARNGSDRLFGEIREAAGDCLHRGRQRSDRLLAETRLNADRHRQRARSESRAALVGVMTGARQAIIDARRSLPQLRQDVLINGRSQVREASLGLAQAIQDIGHDAGRQVGLARQLTEALAREVAGQGPAKTLGRGFALVRDPDGRPLTSARTSAGLATVQLQFQDGRIQADIQPSSLTSDDPARADDFGPSGEHLP